jgi:hypothetical protein
MPALSCGIKAGERLRISIFEEETEPPRQSERAGQQRGEAPSLRLFFTPV